MAAKKSNPAMEFIVDSLKSNRGAKYGDIAEAAAKKKLQVYPIMFGRAQALLGIVKQAARGQGKMALARAAEAGMPLGGMPLKRGPGRPPKSSGAGIGAGSGTGSGASIGAFAGTIEGIVAAVKSNEQAKARYRAALERIQAILTDTLG